MYPPHIQSFLEQERLPNDYGQLIEEHFNALAETLAQQQTQAQRPLLVGINGCQGSGKTTLSRALVMLLTQQGKRACCLSVDDFYLTQAERHSLDLDVHPLLASRGVPGTHDTGLMQATLSELLDSQRTEAVQVPQFSKADDERCPEAQWLTLETPQDIIFLEGWFVGVTPQNFLDLIEPVNTLEKEEDKDGIWRHFVNTQLQQHYQPIFQQLDKLVMLQAPSFDCVHRWRLEQEDKLREALQSAPRPAEAQISETELSETELSETEPSETKSSEAHQGLMDAAQISRFIQHFQRLTQHSLETLPATADHLFVLDPQRRICDYRTKDIQSVE